MLYCKKCQKEVAESETDLGVKQDDIKYATGNELGQGPGDKGIFIRRRHKDCGGEVVDQDSVQGVKDALHPNSQ
jgi:hypothetical protein